MCQCPYHHRPILATNGLAIRDIREQAGLTLRGFARHIGTTPIHLSKVERGLVRPQANLRNRIANGLGVAVDEISFTPQMPSAA